MGDGNYFGSQGSDTINANDGQDFVLAGAGNDKVYGNDDTDIGTARRNSIQRIRNMMEMTGSTKCVMNLTATGSTKADRWVIAMRGKLPGHGIDDPSFLQPDRPMSAIGG